jgi:excinuclease ABC subunit A
VILVEHDMRVIAASDWIIDIGPGAGDEGAEWWRKARRPR